MKESIDTKETIRKRMIDVRRNIPMFEKREADRRIAEVLVRKKPWRDAAMVCLYVSLPAEVDTRALIDESFRQGKMVVVPKVRRDEGIVLHRIDSVYDLRPGPMHNLEPLETCPVVGKNEIGLFIIPLLAFDRSLYRLGWGGGMYDRLLSGVRAPKIGLAFDAQSVDVLPHDNHDIPLDMVITEAETYLPPTN